MNATEMMQLRDGFLSWQCRVRQIAMREEDGRPSAGMRPRITIADGKELSPGVIILIVKDDPYESTEFFRFQVQKTNDPALVRERGLKYLQSGHFQGGRSFSDRMTAVFGDRSALAASLLDHGQCVLEFSEYNQSYTMPCTVSMLEGEHPARDATIWHNRMFNTNLPDEVIVLEFAPDWGETKLS